MVMDFFPGGRSTKTKVNVPQIKEFQTISVIKFHINMQHLLPTLIPDTKEIRHINCMDTQLMSDYVHYLHVTSQVTDLEGQGCYI